MSSHPTIRTDRQVTEPRPDGEARLPHSAAPGVRGVRVDPQQVVQSDFLGIGVNVIPTALVGRSVELGYTPAHWEVDRRRILSLRPKVARMWFQPDWLQRTKGTTDWERPEFASFIAYLDAFREAGTGIELNVGWKVAGEVQSWYAMEGADPRISAPRDLEWFADTTADLLTELILRRGYTNVRYLTFYNEPNGDWDFDVPGTELDQQRYYARLLRVVGQRLRERGLRDLVEFWGPEESGAPGWTAAMAELVPDEIDQYTFHVYGVGFDELPAQIAARVDAVGDAPLGLTEFGWGLDETSGWESGYAGTVIAAAAAGLRTCLVWQLNGAFLTDSNVDTNGDYTLWDSLLYGPDVKRAYRSAGLLMRTIPSGSVVSAATTDPALRAAAFLGRAGGLVTVVEHSPEGTGPLDLTVEGWHGEHQWYALDYSDAAGGNAVPGVARRVTLVDGRALDTLPPGYGFTIYTTTPPRPQVLLTPSAGELQPGDELEFSAQVRDAPAGIAWELAGVPAGADAGRLDRDGRYLAPAAVPEEFCVAVVARSVAEPTASAAAVVKLRPRDPDLAAPVFTEATGQYRREVELDLAHCPPGTRVRFTTDLTEPGEESPLWEAPLVVAPGGTICVRAAAFAPDGRRSRTVEVLIHTLGEPAT